MIYISKIHRNSSNGEVDATVKVMLAKLNESDWSSDAFLTAIRTKLTALYESLNEAIKRGKAESELEDRDSTRDKALSNLFNLVKGFTSVSGEVGEAAFTALGVLNKYGLSKTANANYANESAYINSMLADLATTELLAALEKLPFVADIIADLKKAQQEFETAYKSYISELAIHSTKSSATSIKGDVLKVINEDLVDYLKVMSKVNAAVYEQIASEVGKIIADNNERVNKRKQPKE